MSLVSVRFEEMTASHRFELQSETKDDHQQSRKLRQMMSISSVYDICRLQTADCRLQTADCRLQTADCRLQTADCRTQIADCRPQIADCKLKDTKNLPNKGDTIKNITSCESEKVAWEQG